MYCATKLANVLFTREFARRYDDTKITANAVHPGFVGSNFAREGDMGFFIGIGMLVVRPFAISSANGARTSIYLASSPDVDGITGQYFYQCKVAKPSNAALDDAAAERLWDVERGDDRPQLSSASSGSALRAFADGRALMRHAISAITRPRPPIDAAVSAWTVLVSPGT